MNKQNQMDISLKNGIAGPGNSVAFPLLLHFPCFDFKKNIAPLDLFWGSVPGSLGICDLGFAPCAPLLLLLQKKVAIMSTKLR